MKRLFECGKEIINPVVPYIGTWIETPLLSKSTLNALVVPYIGTWIETPLLSKSTLNALVVPYIGTWIETFVLCDNKVKKASYLI